MEHLDELRKRAIRATIALVIAFCVAGIFYQRLVDLLQRPLSLNGLKLTMTHPTDAIELDIKTAFVAGAILASPFILYQVWLFISPGMYAHEKKYVFPFMGSTVGLFLGGAWFGYHWVLPNTMKILVLQFGAKYNHMIAIEEYTGFFLSIILGLGVCFELPILMGFLAMFGIVDAKFFFKQWRYAVLIIFLIAAFLCPDPSPVGMGLFASPMLALYLVGVLIAYYVHPKRRKAKELTAA